MKVQFSKHLCPNIQAVDKTLPLYFAPMYSALICCRPVNIQVFIYPGQVCYSWASISRYPYHHQLQIEKICEKIEISYAEYEVSGVILLVQPRFQENRAKHYFFLKLYHYFVSLSSYVYHDLM